VRITTFAGLAREAVQLYWPLMAEPAGFADPAKEPTFLNLETAQFHMTQFVEIAFEQGRFDAIRVQPQRVVSQVLDNLNKAALHGFTIEQAYNRLELGVPQGQSMAARINVLSAARDISEQYRTLCLRDSLVDFSLWITLFREQALVNPWSRAHLFRSHQHLIFDNAEEDTYAAHSLVRQWLPHLKSALILVDEDAGYRLFLGADPAGAASLAQSCDHRARLPHSHITPPALDQVIRQVQSVIGEQGSGTGDQGSGIGEQGLGTGDTSPPISQSPNLPISNTPIPNPPLTYATHRFYPQMIDWVVGEIRRLVEVEGVARGEIAVLAPFVSDALRFSLQTRLDGFGIASTTHRPSRAINAEPAAKALITLARLAHPTWQQLPLPSDVALALHLILAPNGERLDPVRASLLGRVGFRNRGERAGGLNPFAEFKEDVKQRITYAAGERYEQLREWLTGYQAETDFTPLDQFFARVFGEVLSQPGFGFHRSEQPGTDPGQTGLDAARVTSQLIESARNFRWALTQEAAAGGGDGPQINIGRVYLDLVSDGALGALYVPGWEEKRDAVFIAPAYTYLMRNRPVEVQFWLDIGATGWWERLYQPLTHPHVLSQNWPANQIWSDLHEFSVRQQTLRRLVIGLLRRTRSQVYLALSDFSESGMEQRGPLLGLINQVLVRGG
jgi:hypothetical protein